MKTLLINPRFYGFSSPPLGLAYIAAKMRAEGLEVDLLDCTFHTTIDDVFNRIKKYNPDIVGLSLMTPMIRMLKELLAKIRSAKSNVIIVAGGPHPSVLPEETLDYGVDIVVIGEGENTMVELAKALENRKDLKEISGLVYKENEKIIKTGPCKHIENLDELPFPARDLLPMKEYLECNIGRSSWTVPRPSTTIQGSRGCPYSCTFCAAKLIHGRKVRTRSPQNVADEIEELIEKYNIHGLWFNDDSFTANKKWVLGLLDEFEKRKIDIGWSCNTRVNLVDQDLLHKMKKHGCRLVSYGVESGVQEVLDKYLKKGIKLPQVQEAFEMASEAGIVTQATFMVGTPGESIENMYQSLEFAKKIEPDSIQVAITTPLPKTEIVEIAQQMGEIETLNWEEMDYMWHGVIKTKDFNPEQVRKVQKEFMKKFYFRPKYFITQLTRIHSFADFEMRVRGFYQLIGGHISPLAFFRRRVS